MNLLTQSRYSSTAPVALEDVLGDADDRYFGAGYRGVVHSVREVRISSSRKRVDALGAALYPENWSADASGSRRSPHLASIDAVVLPLLVLEQCSTEEERRYLAHLRVDHIELRSGSTPWNQLDDVPITVNLEEIDGAIIADASVGNMRAKLTLVPHCSSAEKPTPDAHANGRSVYGGLYTMTRCESSILTLDGSGVVATHALSVAGETDPVVSGFEAASWPSPNVIDFLVTMGQLSQAALYASGGTNRARVGTLWMRTMTISINRKLSQMPAIFETSTRIVRDRLLERVGPGVHDVVVESSSSTGVFARSTLAYTESTLP
jgi:hypothetical protein